MKKCEKCGLGHDNSETCEKVKERLKLLQAHMEVKKEGFSGIMPNGNLVDRRKHPSAIPVQENRLLRVPEPKPLATVSFVSDEAREGLLKDEGFKGAMNKMIQLAYLTR